MAPLYFAQVVETKIELTAQMTEFKGGRQLSAWHGPPPQIFRGTLCTPTSPARATNLRGRRTAFLATSTAADVGAPVTHQPSQLETVWGPKPGFGSPHARNGRLAAVTRNITVGVRGNDAQRAKA